MAYLLVVDDDEDYANSVATALRQDDHEVGTELDTDTALAAMQARRPDLVVLDVMFPEDASAGFLLAQAMHRGDSDLKTVPILMLTAINAQFPLGFTERDIDKTWLPVSEFLEKPVDLDVLREKVSALLEASAAAGEAGN